MHDKNSLLNETKEIFDNEKELSLNALIIAYLSIFIVLALFLPKIYIASNIYFESIQTNKLKKQMEILEDENKYLFRKLEYQKFIDSLINKD